jgi:AcrR family transcriptional regulator
MESAIRELLLEAMLRELGEKGRKGIRLARVLATSEVTREQFTAEYSDIDACLDAAYEQAAGRIADAVRVGCETAAGHPDTDRRPWPTRVRRGLEALLAGLAGDPLLARALICGFPSLGGEAQRRYQVSVESFGTLLTTGREYSGVEEELPAGVEMLAVGAAEAIIFEEVASGRTEQLPRLGPSVLFSVLVPFLGPVSAAAEMEKARRLR